MMHMIPSLLNTVKYAILLLLLTGCRKITNYPDTPQISFISVVCVDSTDVLDNPVKRVTATFHLIDGDGNVGLKNSDTTGPYHKDSIYYYNLFLQEFKKENGTFTEIPAPGGLKRYRIPDLTPTGQNKTLVADISVTIEYPYSDSDPLPFKEFLYKFYLVDRSLNISNKDSTSLISW